MATNDLPIVKMGTLYFIPIDEPKQRVDLSDFAPEDTSLYHGTSIVDFSTQDQFRMSMDSQDYLVVKIPPLNNGDMRNMEDIINELERVYRYLSVKGVVPFVEYPGVVPVDPFAMVPQLI